MPSLGDPVVKALAVVGIGAVVCVVAYRLRPKRKRQFQQASVDTASHVVPKVKSRKDRQPRTSLIPEALLDVEALTPMVTPEEEIKQRKRSLEQLNLQPFPKFLKDQGLALKRKTPQILQLSVGLYCNQACSHCHVESSPLRTEEQMSEAVAARCLELLGRSQTIHTLDLTGGAPELNQAFRQVVIEARALRPKLRIIDRCNLTVLLEPSQDDLAEFLQRNRVDVVASLPCYSAGNVDAQRGKNVFERSIEGLKILNEYGYGKAGTGLRLDLVYNPAGPFLPPPQKQLEDKYRQELFTDHGIVFSNLIVITNLPIKRYHDFLQKRGELENYMSLLVQNFNPATVEKGLMCQDTVNVDWKGRIYDCDFNQHLELFLRPGGSQPLDVFTIQAWEDLVEVPIQTRAHCFGCTAGQGSSCQGALDL